MTKEDMSNNISYKMSTGNNEKSSILHEMIIKNVIRFTKTSNI